jgi:hypothetical protein
MKGYPTLKPMAALWGVHFVVPNLSWVEIGDQIYPSVAFHVSAISEVDWIEQQLIAVCDEARHLIRQQQRDGSPSPIFD